VYEHGKQRRWTGTCGGGKDLHRVVAPVKKKMKDRPNRINNKLSDVCQIAMNRF
jgi:hypothetical protein